VNFIRKLLLNSKQNELNKKQNGDSFIFGTAQNVKYNYIICFKKVPTEIGT